MSQCCCQYQSNFERLPKIGDLLFDMAVYDFFVELEKWRGHLDLLISVCVKCQEVVIASFSSLQMINGMTYVFCGFLLYLGADGCGDGADCMPGGGREFWWDVSFLSANQNKNQNIFIDKSLLKVYMLYMLTLLQ